MVNSIYYTARMNHDCPRCGAQKGDSCHTPKGRKYDPPHNERCNQLTKTEVVQCVIPSDHIVAVQMIPMPSAGARDPIEVTEKAIESIIAGVVPRKEITVSEARDLFPDKRNCEVL